MDVVGCVPVFWKRFVSNSSFRHALSDCNKEQYGKIYTDYSPTRNFENAARYYINPCTQMTTSVTTTNGLYFTSDIVPDVLNLDGEIEKPNLVAIKLRYTTEDYKEILNNEAYSIETLCSQVGGYIGM